MRSTRLTLSVLLTILILVGCSPVPQPAATQSVVFTETGGSSTSVTLLETPTSSASPSSAPTTIPTNTPSNTPTSTPAPDPAPPAKDFNAENFNQFAQIQSYAKPLETLLGKSIFSMYISALAYSPDGRYLAIGGCTGQWSGRCVGEMKGDSEVFIVVQDAQTAEVVARLPEKKADISSLAFTSDGEKLVYTTYPAQVVVWNLVSGQMEHVLLQTKDVYSYPQVAISPDDSIIAAVVASQLLVWDAVTGEQIADRPAFRYLTDLPQFSADGSRLAVFSADQGAQITVYETSAWEPVSVFQPSRTEEVGAIFSPDGMQMATYERNGEDQNITLWDVDTGLPIGVFAGSFTALNTMAFSADSKLLVVSGSSQLGGLFESISIWNIKDQQLIGFIPLEISPTKIIFSADGSSFLVNDYQFPNAYLWSLPDPTAIAIRQAAEDFLAALAQGDFETAAALYLPTPEDQSYFESIGLNLADLPGLLEELCTQSATGCLQPAEIIFVAKEYLGDYGLLVRFSNPDGSLSSNQDGYNEEFIYAGLDEDGSAKLNLLPQFLYP